MARREGTTLNNMLVIPEFHFFWGGPLSQWHPSPFKVKDKKYATAEQWMMSRKAALFADSEIEEQIMATQDPSECKKLGRKIKNFNETIWKERRLEVVTMGNVFKFRQNRDLKEILKNTGGKIIVEASPYDCIWGIGMNSDVVGVENPANWKGLNLLGVALMTTRHIVIEKDRGNL